MTQPMSMIREPHSNDVLSGRGAGITKHPGNKRWRELIKDNRPEYTSLPRNERPQIAERIVRTVRTLTPPGRFLTKDPNTQLWYDIGDERAVEKTAQAMRDSKKNTSTNGRKARSLSPVRNIPGPPKLMATSSDVTAVTLVAANTSAPTTTKPNSPPMQQQQQQQQQQHLARPTTVADRQRTDENLVHKLIETLEEDADDGLFFDDIIANEDQKNSDPNNNKTMIQPPPQTQSRQMPIPPMMMTTATKKPSIVNRQNTFDMRLDQMSFHSLRGSSMEFGVGGGGGRPSCSRDSTFSFQSFDMLEEDEFQMLEESCGMPSQRMSRPSFRMPSFTTTTTATDNNNTAPYCDGNVHQQYNNHQRVSSQDKIQQQQQQQPIVQQHRISRQSRNQFYADVQCMMTTTMMEEEEEDNDNFNTGGENYYDDVFMEDATATTTMMRPSIRYTKRSDPYNRVFNNSF